jgi:3-hydroxybutyryl-CoA dehydrogenase
MKLEDIKNIGVVGGGTMGFGLAINFAMWDYPVIVCDISDGILAQSKQMVKTALSLFAEEGLITSKHADDTISRITYTTDIDKVAAESDFITECIVERSESKRELFNKLDAACPPHTVLASNTSALMLSDFASDVKRQDKVVVTHYFAPPHIVPGVEVGPGPQTSDETINLAYDLMKRIRKVPVKVLKELPGCLLNRIQGAMGREATRLWAEGVASAEDIELGIKSTFGFRNPHEGPMLHYDVAGIWKWPLDVRKRMGEKRSDQVPELSDEAVEKLKARYLEGTPWFVDPERFDEAVEKRDREYIHRLRELYWTE